MYLKAKANFKKRHNVTNNVCKMILNCIFFLDWHKTAYRRLRDPAIYIRKKEAHGHHYFDCSDELCPAKLKWNSNIPNSDPVIIVSHVEHSAREWNDAYGLLKLEGLARQMSTTNLKPLEIRKRLFELPEYKNRDGYRLGHGVNKMVTNWVKSMRRPKSKKQQREEAAALAQPTTTQPSASVPISQTIVQTVPTSSEISANANMVYPFDNESEQNNEINNDLTESLSLVESEAEKLISDAMSFDQSSSQLQQTDGGQNNENVPPLPNVQQKSKRHNEEPNIPCVQTPIESTNSLIQPPVSKAAQPQTAINELQNLIKSSSPAINQEIPLLSALASQNKVTKNSIHNTYPFFFRWNIILVSLKI